MQRIALAPDHEISRVIRGGWQMAGGLVVLTGIALAQTARAEPVHTPLQETPAPLST